MTNAQAPQAYMGKTAVDAQGNKIGSVGQVYVNDTSGRPDWITVNTGLFGTKEHFAPLHGSSIEGEHLVLPVDKDVVKNSPDIADSEHLDADESDSLHTYYQQYLGKTGRYTETVTTGEAKTKDKAKAKVKAAPTGNTDGYLTRSEEQLHVGTERVAAGRAVLRKFVVTEQQTATVPVSHEEAKIVREPLQPGDSLDKATIGEASIEVNLMAEEAVVDKKIVGVEKVKLATQTVTGQQQVTEQVRKEQIETTGDTGGAVPDPAAKKK